jgi:ribosome-binding protein aMBF1 (putative translation factor)
MECWVCGKNLEDVNYYEAISPKGLIKICEFCNSKENFPVLKKPTDEQIKKSKEIVPFYKKAEFSFKIKEPKNADEKINLELKEIVNKNYEKSIIKEKKKYQDLIENFNWEILNARRRKKITREKIAQDLEVPEAAIKFVEQGFLPEDYETLIRKLENYLGIKLFKEQNKTKEIQKPTEEKNKIPFILDRESIKKLKVSDLKKIQEQQIYEEIIDFEEV